MSALLERRKRYIKLGGWLFVSWLMLGVFHPSVALIAILGAIGDSSNLAIYDAITTVLLATLTIPTAIFIWRADRRATRAILIYTIYSIAMAMGRIPMGTTYDFIYGCGQLVVIATTVLAWYFYYVRSERVKVYFNIDGARDDLEDTTLSVRLRVLVEEYGELGGWLLFLMSWLVGANILTLAVAIIRYNDPRLSFTTHAERLAPVIVNSVELLLGGVCAYLIVRARRQAISMIRTYFVIGFTSSIVAAFFTRGNVGIGEFTLYPVWSAIWFAYLSQSERVEIYFARRGMEQTII